MKLLEPREFGTLDPAEVRNRFNAIMNVPGAEYPDLEVHVQAVTNDGIPHTARTALLMGMPYVVVEIMKEMAAQSLGK